MPGITRLNIDTPLPGATKAELVAHYAAVSARLRARRTPSRPTAIRRPVPAKAMALPPVPRKPPGAAFGEKRRSGRRAITSFSSDQERVRFIVGQTRARRLQPRHVKRLTARVFGVRPQDLDGLRRTARMVRPRQVAMAVIRIVCGTSLVETGRLCGRKGHAPVLRACRKYHAVIQAAAAKPAI